jgi:hypothetical protein
LHSFGEIACQEKDQRVRVPVTFRSAVMKAYIITTGTIFGLLVIAPIWGVIVEGPPVAKNPLYVFMIVASAALSIWARRAWRAVPRS